MTRTADFRAVVVPTTLTITPTLNIITTPLTSFSKTTTPTGLLPLTLSHRVPAATTVTIHVTPTPSHYSPTPAAPAKRPAVYGDLTAAYIILLFIPVIVVFLAALTVHLESRRKVHDEEIEMQPYHKFWFPWRELDEGEESNEVSGPVDRNGVPFSFTNPRIPHSTIWPPSSWDYDDGKKAGCGTPAWGRRHAFSQVRLYPSTLPPRRPKPEDASSGTQLSEGERRFVAGRGGEERVVVKQTVETTGESSRAREQDADVVDQIYGRTGSRRNETQSAEASLSQPEASKAAPASGGGVSNPNTLPTNVDPSPSWDEGIPSYYNNGQSPKVNIYELNSSSDDEEEERATTAAASGPRARGARRAGKQPAKP
ncbi:uncharacterized protein CTRU02_201494 [Colletotrichum truncatum]|uniref:Uncharacterized protein n=1 Tax=Colletotrichum truncatum TaxID=5467 RepID=A0ACC3ZHH4_COLTU